MKPFTLTIAALALAGCVSTAEPEPDPGSMVAECLDLIDDQLPGAAALDDWPTWGINDHGLADAGWYGSYDPLGNHALLRSPDVYPAPIVRESVICHEVYHYATFKLRGIQNTDCEEAGAYAVALAVLERNPLPAIVEYIAGQRTLQQRHADACAAR